MKVLLYMLGGLYIWTTGVVEVWATLVAPEAPFRFGRAATFWSGVVLMLLGSYLLAKMQETFSKGGRG